MAASGSKQMYMNVRFLLATIAIISALLAHAEDGKNKAQADLKSVTVYSSGAELTHTANTTLKQGNNELIIDNISNAIDVNSLQIKAPLAVTILSVEFSNNYLVDADKTPRAKLLVDSLGKLQDRRNSLDLQINNTTDLLEVLKLNRNIKGEQNGLSVAELAKLMDYYKTKSLELQTDLQQLTIKKNNNAELLTHVTDQIVEEQKKNTKTAGRLTLQLSAAMAGKADFTVSYIATNAYWTPYYDVRADDIKSPMKLIYKAKIVQTTGIDWKQVKLSLSTSVPAQWGNAPVMQSWFLGYINPVTAMNVKLRGATSIESALQGRVAGVSANALSEVVVVGYGVRKDGDFEDKAYQAPKPVYVVNGAIMSEYEYQKLNPNSIKSINKLKAGQAQQLYGAQAAGGATVVELKDGLEDYVSVAEKALNVSFDIDMPYDVPTNGKEQTATLQTIDVPVQYEHFAAPKLDKDAYLIANLDNWEKLNLLPGSANIIFEGTYVGKTFIDPNSTQDTLHLTLGRDKRVAIKRDKLTDYSSVKFLGSNKLQKFTYEITIKNNKTEAVNMVLKDQYPLTTNKEIEVELLESSSADINKETGLLSWKLALAPGETKKIRFAYSIKYPKDKVLNLN